MDIRKPSHEELNQILTLSSKALLEGTLGEVCASNEEVEQLVNPLLDKGSYYLMAADENKLLGWVLIGESKDSFTKKMTGFIYELYVTEESRGQGVSKALMNAAIHQVKEDGYSEVRLSVFAGNRAIALYEKMGFEVRTVSMSLQV